MGDLTTILRVHGEALQYAAFLGPLALLGAIEAWRRGERAPQRRRRWPANGALTVINIVVIGAIPVSAVALADAMAARGSGLLNMVAIGAVGAFVLTMLLRSLLAWVIHLALHKVGALWRIHRVHHSDPHLDISTTARFHPLEVVISAPIVLGAVALLGLAPVALIVYEIVDAALAVFTHADIRLPRRFERFVRLILVTPDMHRIHHSAEPTETDSNYGATLSCWDRLFGTYRAQARPGGTIGLDDGVAATRTSSIAWLLARPFHAGKPGGLARAGGSTP